MGTQGERIRDARTKLGLTQDEFAKRCGVHRKSQQNYELDKRHPSAAYLDALEELGIDSVYIMSGEHRTEHYLYPVLFRNLMIQLLEELGYSEHDALLSLHEFEERLKNITSTDESSDETNATTRSTAQNLLKESKTISMMIDEASELDSVLLGDVLEAVDAELKKQAAQVSNQKRGRIIASTYRSSKAQGKIDSNTLADVVALSV